MEVFVISILYVEDLSSDAVLMGLAFEQEPGVAYHWVKRIEDAKCFLNGEGLYKKSEAHPLPAMVLIDCLLSKGECGLDLIQWMQSHPRTRPIVTVLISDNSTDARFRRGYQEGATLCVRKPLTWERLKVIARALRSCCLPVPCFDAVRILPEYLDPAVTRPARRQLP
jgi:CheY-like chemotaxis protein